MGQANLRGFRASVNPRFEARIPDFMNGILNFSIHFNVVHRKVDWRNPKMKSLNSMPEWYISHDNIHEYSTFMINKVSAVLTWGNNLTRSRTSRSRPVELARLL